MNYYKSVWLGKASIKAEAPLQVILYLVIAGGLLGALFLGSAVANSRFSSLAVLFGAASGIGVCLFLKEKVWLLIPLCYTFAGKVGGGKVPFSVAEMAIMAAFGMYVVFYAMKKAPALPKAKLSDALLYINVFWILIMYIRNPAGVLIFQTDIIGGRPYVTLAIFLCAYWVLQHITIDQKINALVPILMSVSATITAALGVITQLIPSLVPVIHPLYSGVSIGSYMSEARSDYTQGENVGRFTSLQIYSVIVTNAVSSFFRPFPLLVMLRPAWSIVLYSTLLATFFSGYRSLSLYWLAVVLLASYFRNGIGDVVRICLMAVVAIAVVLCVQAGGYHLPVQMQRALSFLPGNWDTAATSSAQSSSEWRFTMWKEALTGNRYIKNKLLGDGYGYDINELKAFMQVSGVGSLLTDQQMQEYFLITGSYHSGPISAIRYAGAIGLFLITALMVSCARYAWSTIKRTRNSPFFSFALFAGIPAIYAPFEYWFIFGGYDSVYPPLIMTLALLNICSRSYDRWNMQATVQNVVSTDIDAVLYNPR